MAAGTLDKSFGTNGYTISDFGGSFYTIPLDQVIDSNNCTIVTGITADKTNKLYIAKYTSTGVLDKTFGGGKGYILGDYYTGQPSEGKSLVIDSNGNIIVTGYAYNDEGAERLLLAKYYSNGEIYKSFGGGKGWITSDFGYSSKDYLTSGDSLALDSSGKIVVTGNVGADTLFIIARYDTKGDLDKSFGGNRTGWVNFTDSIINSFEDTRLVIDDSGSIIVLGTESTKGQEVPFIIVKVTSNGELDKNFGDGKSYIISGNNIPTISPERGGLALDNSNHILVCGQGFDVNGVDGVLLVRYNSFDGSLDDNFGENRGYTVTTIPNYKSSGNSLVIDSNNRIIVTGDVQNTEGTISKTLLARYSSDGKLDKTFGGEGLGYSITSFGDANNSSGFAVSLDNNGLIVVSGGGIILSTGSFDLVIARYFNSEITTTTSTTTTTEPICLPAGTPILTDQGLVAIDKIDTKKHTIGKKRIVAITTTITPEKHLVCFEANSMGINCPTQRTLMTPGHEVLYKGKLVQSKHFVGRLTGVHTVPYNGKDVLYNVLQEQHGLMRVNNMVLETLHPENKVAKTHF
jgi:uncharacterized delta-60 repeat protein